jgi:flavodoxin I
MTAIGLFFGSTDGNTAYVAEMVAEKFSTFFGLSVELLDVAEYYLDEALRFDCLILGIPTWNTGQLQQDWDEALAEFDELDLAGKRVAVFGLGDQVGYAETFVDAIFFLADKARERGATLVGCWPLEGYRFTRSWAVEDGMFLGLVLDQDNQSGLTEARVETWVRQLGEEFGLDSS